MKKKLSRLFLLAEQQSEGGPIRRHVGCMIFCEYEQRTWRWADTQNSCIDSGNYEQQLGGGPIRIKFSSMIFYEYTQNLGGPDTMKKKVVSMLV
jgi:hypothetical protein